MGDDDLKIVWQINHLRNIILKLFHVYVSGFGCGNILYKFLKLVNEKSIKETKEYLLITKIVESENLKEVFPNFCNSLYCEMRINVIISNFFKDFDNVTKNYHFDQQIIDLKSIPIFDLGKMTFNVSNSNKYIHAIKQNFEQNKSYFYLTFLNGSLGTNDYKPGWSDIDIFAVVPKEIIFDPEQIENIRRIVTDINAYIYKYNILQLHGLFLSTELDLMFHSNSHLPIVCLRNGKILHKTVDKLLLNKLPDKTESFEYFNSDIYNSSKKLLKKKSLKLLEKVLLCHRIYSFPFAFLQCTGKYLYKRDSYKQISDEYSHIFYNIETFYQNVNLLYENWSVNILRSIGWRDFFIDHFHPRFINEMFLYSEKEIIDQTNYHYLRCVKPNIPTFDYYLNCAKTYLEKYHGYRRD